MRVRLSGYDLLRGSKVTETICKCQRLLGNRGRGFGCDTDGLVVIRLRRDEFVYRSLVRLRSDRAGLTRCGCLVKCCGCSVVDREQGPGLTHVYRCGCTAGNHRRGERGL